MSDKVREAARNRLAALVTATLVEAKTKRHASIDVAARLVADHILDDGVVVLADDVAAMVREAQERAWEIGHEVCEWPSCASRHANPYAVHGPGHDEKEAGQ